MLLPLTALSSLDRTSEQLIEAGATTVVGARLHEPPQRHPHRQPRMVRRAAPSSPGLRSVPDPGCAAPLDAAAV